MDSDNKPVSHLPNLANGRQLSLPGAVRQSLGLLSESVRRRFYWLVVVACLASILEATSVVIVFELIRLILDPSILDTLPIMRQLFAMFQIEAADSLFIVAAIVMAAFFLLKNLFLGYAIYAQSYFGNTAGMVLAYDLLRRYLFAPYGAIVGRNSSDLIVKTGQAAYLVSSRILASAILVVTETLIILGILGVLIFNEPFIAVVTGAILFSAMTLFYLGTRPLYQRWGTEQLIDEKRVTQIVYESLRSIKEIKILHCAEFFLDAFLHARKNLLRINTNSLTVSIMPRLISETFIIFSVAIVIIIVLADGRSNTAILSTLGLFAFAGFRLTPSLNRLTTAAGTIRQGVGPLQSIRNDFETLSQTQESEQSSSVNASTRQFVGSIEAKNISFRYVEASTPAISDASFRIEQGSFVGLVGGSGAGKTTLVDLILGLLQPDSGEFLLAGTPVDTALSDWRSMFGYVPQEISLLDDSLRRNIALGIEEHAIDDDRIAQAIQMAAISDILDALPDGLNTSVGEAGAKLSGGQRQRLGIARAIYHDAQILILDEVTSALDAKTEMMIIESLRQLCKEKTVLVIAHRLTTIQYCDQLLLMEKGRLIDSGNFTELRERNSGFDEMVRFAEFTGNPIDVSPEERPPS
jgi:ABC-type multidrug transport system fused ATPase/permease subunit